MAPSMRPTKLTKEKVYPKHNHGHNKQISEE